MISADTSTVVAPRYMETRPRHGTALAGRVALLDKGSHHHPGLLRRRPIITAAPPRDVGGPRAWSRPSPCSEEIASRDVCRQIGRPGTTEPAVVLAIERVQPLSTMPSVECVHGSPPSHAFSRCSSVHTSTGLEPGTRYVQAGSPLEKRRLAIRSSSNLKCCSGCNALVISFFNPGSGGYLAIHMPQCGRRWRARSNIRYVRC